MTGILFALTAAVSWGIGAIFVRLGAQKINTPTGTFISMLASMIFVSSLALTLDMDSVLDITPMALLWFSMTGLMSYVLGRGFNYTAIRYIGVSKATPMIASAPLFVIIIAVVFTDESVNLPIVAGTLSIVAGLYLVVTSR